jgi:hypothetical protein
MNGLTQNIETNIPHRIINQNNENLFNVNKIENVNQNFNIICTSSTTNSSSTYLPHNVVDIMTFSFQQKNYYNLFVVDEDITQCNNFLMPKDKSLTIATETYIFEKYCALTKDNIDEIKSFPAIIASKNTQFGGKTDINQEAIYAQITNIKNQYNGIKIEFLKLKPINQQLLNDYSYNFGIDNFSGVTELNRIHWAIKNINLIDALNDNKFAKLELA